jgi:uncharacterized integral membrane protein
MSFPHIVRGLLAVVDGWLVITIISTILQQRRDGIVDFGQDWRFIALAAWCCVPVAGLHGRWDSPLTWGAWAAVGATVASVIGVVGIRRQQKRR